MIKISRLYMIKISRLYMIKISRLCMIKISRLYMIKISALLIVNMNLSRAKTQRRKITKKYKRNFDVSYPDSAMPKFPVSTLF